MTKAAKYVRVEAELKGPYLNGPFSQRWRVEYFWVQENGNGFPSRINYYYTKRGAVKVSKREVNFLNEELKLNNEPGERIA